jgi:hypothetical protein
VGRRRCAAEFHIEPAAADGDGQAIGNLQPPQGGHDRAFVRYMSNSARIESVVSSLYIQPSLGQVWGQTQGMARFAPPADAESLPKTLTHFLFHQSKQD